MHILVYTGAILVLFLFVIMLLNLKPAELPPEAPTIQKFTLLGCTALIALALAWGGVQQWKLEKAEGWEGAILKPEGLREAPAVALTDDKGAPLKDDAGEPIKAEWGSTAHVGRELFFTHALPFEILSVLIIVAVFGGVVLAKRTL
jgi:NADH-quinone oxidoreductase subunit J